MASDPESTQIETETPTKWQRFSSGVNRELPTLAKVYTYVLVLLVSFSAFWIGAITLTQLINREKSAIQIFPQGLNDASALGPLALGAFTALLFNAQQSFPQGGLLHDLYGASGRRLLNAVFFLGVSFVLGTGARIFTPEAFRGWPLEKLLNEVANLTPAVALISALIAFCYVVAALFTFARTLLPRADE